MDVESECSVLESVEDNRLTSVINNNDGPDRVSDIGGGNHKVEANGSCVNEIHYVGTSGNVDAANSLPIDGRVKEDVKIEQAGSPTLSAISPDRGSPPATKGYGLRKWRRIKRDVVKDGSLNSDSAKALKRGLPSGSANQSNKPVNLTPVDNKQNSDGSVGSINVLRNVGVADGIFNRGPSLESRFPIGPAFAAGTDSENSEDRSSKSSTAASAPRMRNDLHAVLGNVREKNRVKNLSGKGISNSVQWVQLGKGQVESSKKPRGERVKIETENSHSSVESDSRSSNFVFMQGVYSMTSNGRQSATSMNYDGENSDEAHAGEQEYGEEVQTGYGQENVGEDEDLSRDDAEASWVDKEEKSENHRPSTDQDPLVESILALHSVQEALENEVKKFVEIGKVSNVPADSTPPDLGNHDSRSSDEFDSANFGHSSSLESQVLALTVCVKNLESRLEEADDMLKLKEFRVAELESTLNKASSHEEESGNIGDLQHENSEDMETELEGLFKQKIEAEVEYLALSKMIQKMRVAAGDQITLFEEQEALAVEQSRMLSKLGEAESKAAHLKKEAEHLEEYCADILDTKEMQKRVCKVTSCFVTQVILLVLIFYLLVLQLLPHSAVVVPT